MWHGGMERETARYLPESYQSGIGVYINDLILLRSRGSLADIHAPRGMEWPCPVLGL